VSNSADCRIWKLTAAGKSSVFAGNKKDGFRDGNGVSARFSYIGGMCVDQQTGCIFVADGLSIRNITQEGEVSTIAPRAGDAILGICVSPSGKCVYFSTPSAIKKLDLMTGSVECVAGCGDQGYLDGIGVAAKFNWPLDLVMEGDDSLLVADTENRCIRRIRLKGNDSIVETIVGSGALGCGVFKTKFNLPRALCVDDSASTCFVADEGNHCIHKFSLR